MKITNIRFGHATNSSSYHSIVFLPKGIETQDRDIEGGEFGWNFWTASSLEAKNLWLATLLRENLHHVPDYIGKMIIQGLLGLETPSESYIDHQSVYTLPCKFGTKFPDQEFIRELSEFIRQDHVVLCGGNDNEETDHPLVKKYGRKSLPLPEDNYNRDLVCRKNGEREWVVFNKISGTKIRFSFDSPTSFTHARYERFPETIVNLPTAPELVDLKITNRCNYGCEFCYQNSTPDGRDQLTLDPYNLIHKLADMKVFEVAIGGGEPTLSNNFDSIIRYCNQMGIVPNFSTKNYGILHNPNAKQLLKSVGGIAFSITPNEVYRERIFEKLHADIVYNCLDQYVITAYNKISFQLILELFDEHSLRTVLRQAYENNFHQITLLGLKSVGRGNRIRTRTPQRRDWWISVIEEFNRTHHIKVGIDTAIAANYAEELSEHNVNNLLYETREGIYSCYIDMVEGKIGPSSYAPEDSMVALERGDVRRLSEIFISLNT